jgi:hypothetical protein
MRALSLSSRRARLNDPPGARPVGHQYAESVVIHTPDQRVRVFVSSTMQELAPERRAVREAIESLRLTPVMFELGPGRIRRVPSTAPT